MYRLVGRAIIDHTLASKWLVYDLSDKKWSATLAKKFDLDSNQFPEIRPSGSAAGVLQASIADDLHLPKGLQVVVGGFDTCCAALGSGAVETGCVALLCGSWEGVVAPTTVPVIPMSLGVKGLSVGPHVGQVGFAVFALSPNGAVTLDWASKLLSISPGEVEQALRATNEPSPILSLPHLSGAAILWPNGQKYRGALLGLTLGTSPVDILQALMESIVYELALTVGTLDGGGIPVRRLRASGGGAQRGWWMQLKADLTGVPVEVIEQAEPGALGAALLAGAGVGEYASIEDALRSITLRFHRYDPESTRAARYARAFEAYRAAASAAAQTGWLSPYTSVQ